jgi:hypothetical protein
MFHSEKYDFWPVYESINKYYSTGVVNESNYELNNQDQSIYQGQKELTKVILDNIHDEKVYTSTWKEISLFIEEKTARAVESTTYGQAPCISGEIEIQRSSMPGLVRLKKLNYFISLLGPYYSIIGSDESIISDNGTHYVTNLLIASPVYDYEETYKLTESIFTEKLPGYRQIPFHLCKERINGLRVTYTESESTNYLFNALFNDHLDLSITCVGDTLYGADKWIRPDYNASKEKGWTIYPAKNN